MKRVQYETVVGWFADKGCRLLTSKSEYNNGRGTGRCKVNYIASCGHFHSIPVYSFMQGHGIKCPRCAKSSKRPSDKELRELCDSIGCKFIRAINFNSRIDCTLEIVANCGHRKITTFKLLRIAKHRHGIIRCNDCAITRKKTIEEVKKLFESNGCNLLSSEYHGKDEKLEYIASCGHHHSISYHNFSSGWGTICPSCAASRSASLVGQILDEGFNGVIREYQCKPTRLKIDFYIPEKSVAIEYDGKQHFEPVSKFGGYAGHKECRCRDRRKARWCKENGIRLIRIDGRKWNYKTMDDIFKKWIMEQINEEKG